MHAICKLIVRYKNTNVVFGFDKLSLALVFADIETQIVVCHCASWFCQRTSLCFVSTLVSGFLCCLL